MNHLSNKQIKLIKFAGESIERLQNSREQFNAFCVFSHLLDEYDISHIFDLKDSISLFVDKFLSLDFHNHYSKKEFNAQGLLNAISLVDLERRNKAMEKLNSI